jgi:alkylated DNA repair protein (DNA oxidative demethylase)
MTVPSGFQLFPAALDASAQKALAEAVLGLIESAPTANYVTPGGKAMSVAMSNLGPLGWVSDAAGYRYQTAHPATGRPWPSIPPVLMDLWARHADPRVPPDACLVNLYLGGEARLAFHGVDRIIPGSSSLIPGGGRLNLTLRRAAPHP